MALRLRRDVQKASYYVWFLGAEEAKGLRGARVINSVLPYLIDRSRSQEPLKVTLQVSHKGIKILQGSSKHFIPHSAITSSVQTDDIVACVLLLYNPATKCPLHVHAYRCDSESTAEALHQQLQILINRPENQKRFEELESRLGILPSLPTTGNKSSSHINNNEQLHNPKQQQPHHYLSQQQQKQQRRNETSPKRFSSSLGSDTGNSTRESECSEEHSGGSPISRSPPHLSAASIAKPLPQPNNELFDSLAAELRAKLNGNGPPLLLPPRDYDTVHRSKGNLTAIELRRCRNSLIVGGATPTRMTTPTTTTAPATAAQTVAAAPNVKQVSSRGSSGIGSDLAPSPERQELNSSSDDEQWSNEADNSVIALKPSQIPIDRSPPIIPHHPQLNRKSAVQPPDDSYLRDLPAKPYNPRNNINNGRDKIVTSNVVERDTRTKTPSASAPWSREDEIKPIIMRPADYDAKFNRVLQAEQKQDYHRRGGGGGGVVEALVSSKEHAKLRDTDKYNEINRLLNKKLSLERDPEPKRYNKHKGIDVEPDDFDDSDPASDHVAPPAHVSSSYRKENLTDKQKFMEYSSSKKPSSKPYVVADEAPPRYGGRHRYADPADLPFEQPAPVARNKYAAVHRGTQSPERSDLGHRPIERDTVRQRSPDRERERKHFSHSNERNPYREPESIPYIQSMEKMMKSSAMRYKSFDGIAAEPTAAIPKDDAHIKVNQRSKSYPKNDEFNYARGRPDYAASAGSNVIPKDRYKDVKDKSNATERNGSRYDLTDEKDGSDYKPRRRGGSIEKVDSHARVYEDWSDDERFGARDRSPPPVAHSRSRSRSRDHLWEANAMPTRERDVLPHREPQKHSHKREREPPRDFRDYAPREMAPREMTPREMRPHEMTPREMRPHEMTPREMRPHEITPREMRQREPSGKRIADPIREPPHSRDVHDSRDAPYRPRAREVSREIPREREHMPIERHREQSHEYVRERAAPRRDYSPDMHSGSGIDHRSGRRPLEKQHQPQHPDMYPSPTPPPGNGAPIVNSKSISNLSKGYRHSYAEPVFARSGGRVGLAAVNPF